MAISLLNAVTSYTIGSASSFAASSVESFTLKVTSTGNFTATILLEQSADSITFTPIKVWAVSGTNLFSDSFSIDVPTNYYVRASLTNITGTSTAVTVNANQSSYSTPAATYATDANGNVVGLNVPYGQQQVVTTIGGINMSLAVEYSVNTTIGNAGSPYYITIPAGKAGGVMWVDAAAAGGGGGGGYNGINWAAGGGGGAAGMSCLMFPVRIPPTTTRLAIIVGQGGAFGATGATAGTAGANGTAGGATFIYDPDMSFVGDATANYLLTLYGGQGGGGSTVNTTGGLGGAIGAPTYLVGGGSSGVNAVGGNGSAPLSSSARILDNLFLQVGGGGGGGSDAGTVAQNGGSGGVAIAGRIVIPYGFVGGASNWKAGGGGGGASAFYGLWPGYNGGGGTGGSAPAHTPTVPGCGGGGGGGNGNGASGADGCVRIYW